ncbi:hypothetical protein [Paenibacillus hexagrammi]|uniref:DUF3955 domain-containing protein n=1 Tax=Paenibacillus hexagrammi TaxID=2908839 RepID=A0ABY3SFQ6_9BACL|nr:hypothetical protein [Paenibacillus sp. YPD9-1]UJF32827.1 hypothetical protein L0M14_25140 [Paenibacillus sp. YPD9-1]
MKRAKLPIAIVGGVVWILSMIACVVIQVQNMTSIEKGFPPQTSFSLFMIIGAIGFIGFLIMVIGIGYMIYSRTQSK